MKSDKPCPNCKAVHHIRAQSCNDAVRAEMQGRITELEDEIRCHWAPEKALALEVIARGEQQVASLREALKELLRAGTDGKGWKQADANARAALASTGGDHG